MCRHHSFRFVAKTVFSSTLLLAFLSGCGSTNKGVTNLASGLKRIAPIHTNASKTQRPSTIGRLPGKVSKFASDATRLSRAFEKNPANSKVALQYIYHLRSLGMQAQAVTVLHKAYQANPTHPLIASEYGRLLLGTGKTLQAQRVLERISPRARPDWHTLSALGTIEARNGDYGKATHYYRQAYRLAPKQVSIVNNLALSIALGGHPGEAENLLRNADDSGRFGARLRQNLALVLALQGKYYDAQAMATTDLPPKVARQNIAYLKRMLATTDRGNGIELSDETRAPVARRMARRITRHVGDAATYTGSIATAKKPAKAKPAPSFGPPTSLSAPGL